MKKIIALMGLALALTACQTTNNTGITKANMDVPVADNTTRVIRTNPDTSKWMTTNGAGQLIAYQCRALACPSPSRITTNLRRSPVIKPDPTALANLAKVEVPKMIAEDRQSGKSTGVLLSSNVASRRNYPSTIYEIAYTRPDNTKYYNVTTNIYAGNLVVYINSSSNDLGVARSNAANYISKLEILQGSQIQAALRR